jgi:ATP-dependent protease HslVU (ClpYQ) peptidase subunit
VTCIVGVASDGKVYMGADRGLSSDHEIVSMTNSKIHIRDKWIFGFSGSLGTGQLMEFINIPILNKGDDPYSILRLLIVEEFKSMVEKYGSLTTPEDHCDFLIGANGRLFEFSTEDWGVAEIKESAVGSGSSFALGSLYSTTHYKVPEKRVEKAVCSAIHYSPSCQGPIDILSI